MRRLMWFSVGFGCACLAATYLLPLRVLLLCALAAGLSAAALLILRRRPGLKHGKGAQELRILPVVLLGLSLGLVRFFLYDAVSISPARAMTGKKQTVTAELCTFPQKTETAVQAEAFLDPDGSRVKARLYLYGAVPALRPGDRITGVFTIRQADQKADGSVNLSLPAKGILLTGSGQISAVEPGGDPLRYFPARLSHAAFLRLGALIPADAAGLPQAMLTGNRSGLSAAKQDILSGAGVSHMIAVSGLHAAMLFALLVLLLGNRAWLTAISGALVLTLYCLMTGASPSVVRACLMLGVFLVAPLLQEETDLPTALALAALTILLNNPQAVAGLSFQLSFSAVAGLLLVSRPVQEALLALPRMKALLTWDGLRGLPRSLRYPLLHAFQGGLRFAAGSFSATLGALLFSTPISVAAFGTLPVYGVLTNLFVLPLASLCLAGALTLLGLGLLFSGLGHFAGALLALPVRAIFGICRLVSRLPGSRLVMDFYGISFLLFVYGLLFLALYVREKQPLRPIGALFAALLSAIWFQTLGAGFSEFTLAALDVGQGQCICILTPGFTAVVDCGGSGGSSAGTEAALWLRRHGVDRIDALILTHYDSDHTNGVTTLLELMPTTTLYLPEVPFKPETRAELEAFALQWDAVPQSVETDVTIPLTDGALRLFSPVSEESDNAACVSILFSAGEYDMLISGDLDVKAERALLERHALPHVELYIAGHHGSSRSSSEELLQAICPDTVFISVGRNNYGLPSEKALKRLAACGAAIYRTDLCGNLEIGR